MKPTIPEVLPLIQAYYAKPGNLAGGSLHIVLDDGNIEDHSIEFCYQYAVDNNDPDAVELAELLLKMSKTQRKRIVSLI